MYRQHASDLETWVWIYLYFVFALAEHKNEIQEKYHALEQGSAAGL